MNIVDFAIEVVIFYSYVSLPEGTTNIPPGGPGPGVSWTKVGDWPQHLPDLQGDVILVFPTFT